MSATPTTTHPSATSAPPPSTIPLACPSCHSAAHLHTVELVEVLVEARFTLGQGEPEPGEGSELLADTQRWSPDTGAIVCSNCDQVDLRYGDLIPAITLTERLAMPACVPAPGATPGASS